MYLTLSRPRVLAHRGFTSPGPEHAIIIENTVPAFEAAVSLGVTYIESDVRSTRDGIAVLLHDPEFVSGRDGNTYRINDVTSGDLERLRLANGERIPTVVEVLERFPNMRFNLDVKESAAVEPLIQALEESRASSRVLVTSFAGRRRRAVRKRVMHTFGGASTLQAWLIAFALFSRQQWILEAMSREIQAAQLPSNRVSRAVLSAKSIERIHRAQIEVHIWTPNTVEDINYWLSRGVAGIITDRADFALRLVADQMIGEASEL